MESDSDSSSGDEEALVVAVVSGVTALIQLAHEEEEEEEDDEEEEEAANVVWGGSRVGKGPNIRRDFEGAYKTLVNQYFSGHESLYNEASFERRFGSPRCVVERLWQALNGCEPFTQKVDTWSRRPGIRPLVRFAACLTMLVYGDCADRLDDHLQMSESSVMSSLKSFCRLVVEKFSNYMNRCPTQEEKERAVEIMKQRGFPGCFGSWDCKHYFWSNCPVALAGQYKGKGGKTLVMEALVDPDLYIWYYNFGSPGSLNDINILDRSNIVGALLSGTFDGKVPEYTINGRLRDWMYFLVDGIYPSWSIFVKTYQNPTLPPEKRFARRQEHVRKDVERAFGVLVAHFGVLERKLRGWYVDEIRSIVNCCIIIHNMTTEARRGDYQLTDCINVEAAEAAEGAQVHSIFLDEGNQAGEVTAETLAARVAHLSLNMEDAAKHALLMADLTAHVTATRVLN